MARRRTGLEQDWREALTASGLLSLLYPSHHTPVTPGVRRKLRLVLCGAARTVWDRLPHDDLRRAIEVAEQFADERASKRELEEARRAVDSRLHGWEVSQRHIALTFDEADDALRALAAVQYALTAGVLAQSCAKRSVTVARVAGRVLVEFPRLAAPLSVWETALMTDWHGVEVGPDPAAAVVRDLFGGPTPARLADEWKTPTVTAIAAGIAADGAFDRLPVLADALEDAGCENLLVLTHCRRTEPHWRGCWVVDGVLGK